jgi:hypothetical protein
VQDEKFRHGFGRGFGSPPFGVRLWEPWGGRPWRFGFPRRNECLQMLEEMQREIEELKRE